MRRLFLVDRTWTGATIRHVFLILGFALFVGPAGPARADITGPVERIIDGDTLVIGGREIALWGVDAPELGQICTIDEDPYDCGKWARKTLEKILAGHASIRCVERGRRPDGRLMAQCFAPFEKASTVDIAAVLVTRGWALDWSEYSDGMYAGDAYLARSVRRGLWGGRFDKPWDWRRGVRDVGAF